MKYIAYFLAAVFLSGCASSSNLESQVTPTPSPKVYTEKQYEQYAAASASIKCEKDKFTKDKTCVDRSFSFENFWQVDEIDFRPYINYPYLNWNDNGWVNPFLEIRIQTVFGEEFQIEELTLFADGSVYELPEWQIKDSTKNKQMGNRSYSWVDYEIDRKGNFDRDAFKFFNKMAMAKSAMIRIGDVNSRYDITLNERQKKTLRATILAYVAVRDEIDIPKRFE